MKIKSLVVLRKEILNYISECSLDVTKQTHSIQHMNESTARHTKYYEKLSGVLDQYQQLANSHTGIVNSLAMIVADLESEIDAVVNHHSVQQNLQVFTEDQQCPPQEQTSLISESMYQQLFSIISRHVDWHYPGLIVNARSKRWIDCLIAMDPLYLTLAKIKQDDGDGFIETFGIEDYYNRPQSKGYLHIEEVLNSQLRSVIAPYSSLYQNRLRLYPIINKNYSNLPKQQFGLILAMETFNNLNQQEVERYLRSCFGLLRAGGTIIFNYVDCDVPVMADMFDQGRVPYASTRSIKKIADDIGYSVSETSSYLLDEEADGYLSLAILKKPGVLATVKAGQSMGKIIEK